MNLGCVLFSLTPLEALRGVTDHAAGALGLRRDRGTLEEGKAADLAVWDIGHPRELSYWMGRNPLKTVVKGGVPAAPLLAGESNDASPGGEVGKENVQT
jgi:imidazolonepropionase